MSTREVFTPSGFVPMSGGEPLALADFLAAPETTDAVLLEPDAKLETLAPHLARIGLIAIRFPKFNDGRGYSLAARLRLHHGYKGRLRAVGDILTDQIQHFFRTGFDELDVTHAPTLERLKAGAALSQSLFMQPAITRVGESLDKDQGYSWRRRA
jgi:uncharacterized protein (DUF934 family)